MAKITSGWFGIVLSTATMALTAWNSSNAQESRKHLHRLIRTSESLVEQDHASKAYLSPDELKRLHFRTNTDSLELSEGHEAKFSCSIDIPDTTLEPTIFWKKNGQDLAENMQVMINELQTITDRVTTLISIVSITQVQRLDAGEYRCRLSIGNMMVESQPITIKVEGLPTFFQQPEDRNITKDAPFNLSCEAVGPPDPVNIRWLRDGIPDSEYHRSPSTYSVEGVNTYTQFSCEAYNSKGVSTSREANINIKVLPSPVSNITVIARDSSKLTLRWIPGHDGFSPLTKCHIRVKEVSRRIGEVTTTRFINATVPPFQWEISGLQAMTSYNMSVSCSNDVGASPVSPWIQSNTTEGVPSVYPRNVTVQLNESWLVIRWKPPPDDKINGVLQGYDIIVRHGVQVNRVHSYTNMAFIAVQDFNTTYSVEVAACTRAGSGMVSPRVWLFVPEDKSGPSPSSSPGTKIPDSVSVVLGVVCGVCLLMLVLWGAICVHNRTSDSWLGRVLGSREKLQPVVQYKPQRSYNRSTVGITLGNLGVSDELHAKLQDVMVTRNLLSIGKILGEGEFGSVVEGNLRQPDGTSEKVAVKTMKLDSFSQREIEEFLNEAACMKDFHHPNVIRLLGVCLELGSGHFPKPMVILPFMKYGDLHTFLLRSRLGENPIFLPTQTLLKFMVDIASGMEYLSGRNFLHRDLAARNCMLRDDMTVCVADFGLSKKIYSGDYYRQGRIAKMPVKWIAVESLADRVFTVKSDVWAFGITMWEIATRGMTPYPGIQNHEIYDYLLEGNRLKQPADCLDDLYELMYGCWRADPLDRPLFPQLREMLEKLTERLPESSSKEDIIYINTSFQDDDPDGEASKYPVLSSSPSCSHQQAETPTITADIHGNMEGEDDDFDRYVVVISPDPSLRSPTLDTPLLSSGSSSRSNGTMAPDGTGTENISSDTSLLL
ncbi:tyrosine-protein kinase Mer isoform X1 [Nerophis ophidion]|uniref:tyrosine-protein kinase Mer isoform X1 n=1 Tax=Nerophis ophidion TaxID=159077 RepID=UPI002AE03676|nr:tyrosine-protein kinase Mer isoform X1 [Nerophis ophidion]